jgi:hypothetical protein
MGTETGTLYRCLALIDIPADDCESYDQLLCEAAEVFTGRGWCVRVSAEKAASLDTTGVPPGVTRKLLHLWQIPDFNSAVSVMAHAADNPAYVRAQSMTLGEVQNFHTTLRWDNPIGIEPTPVDGYLMESLSIVNGLGPRDALANYMDRAVYELNSRYGWRILFAGNATSGIIDQYVHIWGIRDSSTAAIEPALTAYRGDPAWTGAVKRVTTSMWKPRPLTCLEAAAAPGV